MKAKRLYSQEVIPNNLELVKDCKGARPSSNDPVVYVCYRSYVEDYRWRLVELATNRVDHPFAFDSLTNKVIGASAYREDLWEQIGVLGPAKYYETSFFNIDNRPD